MCICGSSDGWILLISVGLQGLRIHLNATPSRSMKISSLSACSHPENFKRFRSSRCHNVSSPRTKTNSIWTLKIEFAKGCEVNLWQQTTESLHSVLALCIDDLFFIGNALQCLKRSACGARHLSSLKVFISSECNRTLGYRVWRELYS